MGISLSPEHLKRYRDLAVLFFRFGGPDVLRRAGLEDVLDAPELPPAVAARVEELPAELERLGPTYVKLGQFLSTRSDVLPPEYAEPLGKLQDEAASFPFDVVEEIVSSELGVRLSRAFLEFDREPLAAASLAQVHRAVTRSGRTVAVKVQRPDVRRRVVSDLEAFEEVAAFLDRHTSAGGRYHFQTTLAEFRKALLRELDFREEAQNLVTLRANLLEFPRILVPEPVDDYTTSRLLTMDYLPGRKITALPQVARLELDGKGLAEELFRAYLKQILIDGLYHADPHPGNVLITEDGRIALLDFGMVARLGPALQGHLLRLLLAISDGRGDEAVEHALAIGDRTGIVDERRFASAVQDLIGRYQSAKIGEVNVGRVVLEVFRAAADNGVRFPAELSMLGKTLLNLDAIGRALDPEFDPNAAVRRYASELFRKNLRRSLSAGSLYEVLLEGREFLQYLPKRVNKILGLLAANELTVRVDAIDEKYLMTGLQKIANRLTAGMILAAVIVGAALMMQVETRFTLFGYPAIAIVFFLLAGFGGLGLAFLILLRDEHVRRRDENPSI